MRPATTEFLRQRFTEYYRKERIRAPPAVAEREFGFILFDPEAPEVRMRRHMGFGTARESGSTSGPSSLSMPSTRARTTPPRGRDHGREGVDRCRPHLRPRCRPPHARALPRDARPGEGGDREAPLDAHRRARLRREGDPPRLLRGRGYHVHVREIALRGWGSQERREAHRLCLRYRDRPRRILSGPPDGTGGWKERYISTISEDLLWLKGLEREKGVEHLLDTPG